jgi:urease accessory protein
MIQVSKCIAQGRGLAAALVRRAAFLSLGWDERQKSRLLAVDSTGRELGIFLPRGSALRGGDVLVADDGSLIQVRAAMQDVLRVTPCRVHGSPFDLLRAAYHLGNRHVQLELQADHLQLEPDPVLADLLRSMDLEVVAVQAPFEPESGAYSSHGNPTKALGAASHSHGSDHGHTHAHSPIDAHQHPHGPSHVHTT